MKFAKFVVAVAVVVAAVHGQVCVDDRDTTSTSPSSTIWLGSRHSYHKAKTTLNNINITSLSPFFPLDLLFDMPNITHQLDAGVRVVEFDVVIQRSQSSDILDIPHVFLNPVDTGSECSTLAECLTKVNIWSQNNPGHSLISVVIRVLGAFSTSSSCVEDEVAELDHCFALCDGTPYMSTALDVVCPTDPAKRIECIRNHPTLELDAATCIMANCRSEAEVLLGTCANLIQCVDDTVRDTSGCCDDPDHPFYCPDCLTCQYALAVANAAASFATTSGTIDNQTYTWTHSNDTASATELSLMLSSAASAKGLASSFPYIDATYVNDVTNQLNAVSAIQSAVWEAGWLPEKILTVADVQGNFDTLAEAVQSNGWPHVSNLRGKTSFIIANTNFNESALAPYPFFRFTESSDVSSPLRAIIENVNPTVPVSNVGNNTLVLTYADDFADTTANLQNFRNASLASHANLILTYCPPTTTWYNANTSESSPANWGTSPTFYIPEGRPAKCISNNCSPLEIENPALLSSGRCKLDDMSITQLLEAYGEQYYTTGTVTTGSSDLELLFDAGIANDVMVNDTIVGIVQGVEQIVAVSFSNIQLPVGAVITTASLQFQCKIPTSGNITMQITTDISEANPAHFENGNETYSISDRVFSTNIVTWQPPDWNNWEEVSVAQQSPELRMIVQEAISQPWFNGSTSRLVFLFKRDSTSLSTIPDPSVPQEPNTTRVAYSGITNGFVGPTLKLRYRPYSGSITSATISSYAEQLVGGGDVSVSSGTLQLPRDNYWGTTHEQIVGLRFENSVLNIPQDATIDYAYIQFTSALPNEEGDVTLLIDAELNTNPFAFSGSNSSTVNYDLSDRLTTNYPCLWTPRSWRTDFETGVRQRTCNVAESLQVLVEELNWDAQSAIVIIISRDESDTGTNLRTAYNGAILTPVLTVQYHTQINEGHSASASKSPSYSSTPTASLSLFASPSVSTTTSRTSSLSTSPSRTASVTASISFGASPSTSATATASPSPLSPSSSESATASGSGSASGSVTKSSSKSKSLSRTASVSESFGSSASVSLTPSSSHQAVSNTNSSGKSNSDAIGAGVGVGVGVACAALVFVGLWWCNKRKLNRSRVPFDGIQLA